MIFMGDTGSLALGGALGAIAVATKHEIVLAIVGGLFVLETLSVIIQVGSYQDDRQARVPHGAAASSLRAEGLAGIDRRRALLDHLGDAGAGRPCHAEAAVSAEGLQNRGRFRAHDSHHHIRGAAGSRCSGSARPASRPPRRCIAGGAEVVAGTMASRAGRRPPRPACRRRSQGRRTGRRSRRWCWRRASR